MKKLFLIAYLTFMCINQCIAQNDVIKLISNIDEVINNRKMMQFKNAADSFNLLRSNNSAKYQQIPAKYTFTFTDSIKFKHPYITSGEPIGVFEIQNRLESTCKLQYFILENVDTSTIKKDVFRYYALSSIDSYVGPLCTNFTYKNYYFFMPWGNVKHFDDACKYLSLYIEDVVKTLVSFNK